MKTRTARWPKEPLFHFLLIGALVYVLYGFFSPMQEAPDDRTVVVTTGEIEALASQWQSRWNRPPTAQELDGVVQQYAREIVLYREALAMGLDKDDIVIRRRLGQKLEFLSQDLMTPAPPERDVLEEWFVTNRDRYREPDVYTITHIFLDPDKRDVQALQDAESVRSRLNALNGIPDDLAEYGDPFMLQSYYPDRSKGELAKLFGSGFAESVVELEPSRWHGPVLSGYGVHVVLVSNHRVAPEPEFSRVEDQVRQDWIDARREELNKQFLDAVMARYEVIIEQADVTLISNAKDSAISEEVPGESG